MLDGSLRSTDRNAGGELAIFEPGESVIELVTEGETRFWFGSAPRHPHPLVLGDYSVHTSAMALRRGILHRAMSIPHSLGRLSAPKVRGITAHLLEPHPLAHSRCEACGVDGFVERRGERLVARLERAPADGIEVLSHARGMNAHPEPWLTWIISAALRDAIEREGLSAGLSTLPFARVRGRCEPYFVVFAENRLAPMATPFGRDLEKRNCDVCGFMNAAGVSVPLYPRPERDGHWFSAPPWQATSVLVTRAVWSFLLGSGRELYARRGAKVAPLPAGWWPDDAAPRDREHGRTPV